MVSSEQGKLLSKKGLTLGLGPSSPVISMAVPKGHFPFQEAYAGYRIRVALPTKSYPPALFESGFWIWLSKQKATTTVLKLEPAEIAHLTKR